MNLADHLETDLPYLRRYARALTGTQTEGDALAYRVLTRIRREGEQLDPDVSVKVRLFRMCHQDWIGTKPANALGSLPAHTREVLLLSTLERFSAREIATILDLSRDDVVQLLQDAPQDIQRTGSGRILIIEDDVLIATDLARIVKSVGHVVVAEARTHHEATAKAAETRPDLILADIELADGSSGIDAIHDILSSMGSVPVIFVTAYPEHLLTGTRPEPVFLVTKPYSQTDIVASAAQAMFFAATEALRPTVG